MVKVLPAGFLTLKEGLWFRRNLYLRPPSRTEHRCPPCSERPSGSTWVYRSLLHKNLCLYRPAKPANPITTIPSDPSHDYLRAGVQKPQDWTVFTCQGHSPLGHSLPPTIRPRRSGSCCGDKTMPQATGSGNTKREGTVLLEHKKQGWTTWFPWFLSVIWDERAAVLALLPSRLLQENTQVLQGCIDNVGPRASPGSPRLPDQTPEPPRPPCFFV